LFSKEEDCLARYPTLAPVATSSTPARALRADARRAASRLIVVTRTLSTTSGDVKGAFLL
jgi:hypothetical protein